MEGRSRRRGRQKDQLLERGEDVDGISNPSMDSETEAAYQTFSQTEGESSAAEMAEEAAEAEHLVKDLKTRRRQRKKALSKLTSPKEDVAGELKSMRSTSRQRVEDTIREEEMATLSAEETTTAPIPPATEDGLATLPTDESILPTEEEIKATEASKEEAESIERAEAAPSAEPPDTERSTKEQPGTPRAAPTGAEAGSKPFGQSSMRARMKERLAKAKVSACSYL
ncbi:hypothetical protein V1264_023294 [Littorina saxatilis]|uniref:Uncharacterized protein n=1 Tax=Littorina saxatilis TaxID=31220 RepID=A0AAN9G9J1_9CAEN